MKCPSPKCVRGEMEVIVIDAPPMDEIQLMAEHFPNRPVRMAQIPIKVPCDYCRPEEHTAAMKKLQDKYGIPNGKGYCRRCDATHNRVFCPNCGLRLVPV